MANLDHDIASTTLPDALEVREAAIPAAKIHFPEDDIRQIQAEIGVILETGRLILGPKTQAFEDGFSRLVGTEHAVAVSSGTAALEIALRGLEVEGKKVVIPVNTFYASAAAAERAGGQLVFADIDPATLALSPQTIMPLLDDTTAAVMMVHIGGFVSPAVEHIASICRERGIAFVEDAAHAHGATFNGKQAGTFGDVGTFSFFPTKVMTSGEGGMIVTNDDKMASIAKIYRDQGKASGARNLHTHSGYAWRMSELHALLGLTQLRRLPDFIRHRRRIAAQYDQLLKHIPAVHPLSPASGSEGNFYKYPVALPPGVDRQALKHAMKARWKVSLSGEVYETPLHHQPVFQGEFQGGPFPGAEEACAHHICLPISAVMKPEEANYVVAALHRTLPEFLI